MKGSNRNKDHSTEGEGDGKRPKRKCLQWHPLLAKKLLDFSEEEEEDEEEEDIDKVSLPLTSSIFRHQSFSRKHSKGFYNLVPA
jgi:hypothetical protein